jgi:uncharacterized protein (TIGR03437 family)
MRSVLFIITALTFKASLFGASHVASSTLNKGPYTTAEKRLVNIKPHLPLMFEPNRGQTAPEIQWISRSPEGVLLLTPDVATMVVRGPDNRARRVTMRIVGARSDANAEGMDALPSYSNYFIGDTPSAWRTRVPHYSKLKFDDVYPGIDLVYYGKDRRLEYDFLLSPGANHKKIELDFNGADRLEIDSSGDLLIDAGGIKIRQLRPKVYQWIDGKKHHVESAYRLSSGSRVRFALSRFDPSQSLIIDPVIQYSTYIGGSGHDKGVDLAIDRTGAMYITGYTNSGDLRSAFRDQQQFAGKIDGMIAKLSATGDSVEWISYYGGRENDEPTSIAIDSGGNAIISGYTDSSDLPLQNPGQAARGAGDAFVAKFNSSGTALLYATYLGGTGLDRANDVATDSAGNAFITGWTRSSDFPTLGSFQSGAAGGGGDVFVTKLPPSGSPLLYSTYVGGNGDDLGTAISVDGQGAAYVTGGTTSTIFPVLRPIQSQNRGSFDAFLFKLNPAGHSLEYSTLLGGSMDELSSTIAIDSAGSVYISGYTASLDFPIKGGFQTTMGGGSSDVFVCKVSRTGTTVEYASYLGGSDSDSGAGDLAVDAAGTLYLTGFTASRNFPLKNPWQSAFGGGRYDTFVTRIAPNGSSLLYSSFLGGRGDENGYGLAVDPQGVITVAGWTSSSDLPSAVGSFKSEGLSPADAFVARVSADNSVVIPIVANTGIMNSATGLSASASPGQLITISGRSLGPDRLLSAVPDTAGNIGTLLGETRVLIDGIAAPLLSVSSTQINAIMPTSVEGKTAVQVEVEYRGQRSASIPLGIAPASPGLFTANSSGSGQAAALNENQTVNSPASPAARGSVVVLYATGYGLTNPKAREGHVTPVGASSAPILPVSVSVNGVALEVLSAVEAPGMISGVLQVNVRLPESAPTGDAIPVVLTVGTVESRSGVTIAIR